MPDLDLAVGNDGRDKITRAFGKSGTLVIGSLCPMDSTSTYNSRQLTEEEISRLERALGKPIERNYLVYWISTGIRDLVKLSTPLVSPSEYRDELKEIVQQGRRWVETLKQSRSTQLLPHVLEVGVHAVARSPGDGGPTVAARKSGTVVS